MKIWTPVTWQEGLRHIEKDYGRVRHAGEVIEMAIDRNLDKCPFVKLFRGLWEIEVEVPETNLLQHIEAEAIHAQRKILLLQALVGDPQVPTFLWSYESYVLLGRPYLAELTAFLGLPTAGLTRIQMPRDENRKYITSIKR